MDPRRARRHGGSPSSARGAPTSGSRTATGSTPASGFGETPIHTAAALGTLHAIVLVEPGADPNIAIDKGQRPLHYAAKCDSREVVEELLGSGANPRLKDGEHDATASDWARFFGHFELAGFLETVEA